MVLNMPLDCILAPFSYLERGCFLSALEIFHELNSSVDLLFSLSLLGDLLFVSSHSIHLYKSSSNLFSLCLFLQHLFPPFLEFFYNISLYYYLGISSDSWFFTDYLDLSKVSWSCYWLIVTRNSCRLNDIRLRTSERIFLWIWGIWFHKSSARLVRRSLHCLDCLRSLFSPDGSFNSGISEIVDCDCVAFCCLFKVDPQGLHGSDLLFSYLSLDTGDRNIWIISKTYSLILLNTPRYFGHVLALSFPCGSKILPSNFTKKTWNLCWALLVLINSAFFTSLLIV